jgi:hypothetical protein
MIRRSWTQAASIEETLALWAASLREIKKRIRPLFTQERVATNAGLFLEGLLGDEQRKTGELDIVALQIARGRTGADENGGRDDLPFRHRRDRGEPPPTDPRVVRSMHGLAGHSVANERARSNSIGPLSSSIWIRPAPLRALPPIGMLYMFRLANKAKVDLPPPAPKQAAIPPHREYSSSLARSV